MKKFLLWDNKFFDKIIKSKCSLCDDPTIALGAICIIMGKEVKNKAFLTYFDSEVMYQMLSDEEAGKLIKAMFRYCKDKEEVLSEKDGMSYGYFAVLKNQYDRDDRKYIQQALKKKERDAKRYQEKKAEASKTSNERGKSEQERGYYDDDEAF